MAGDEKGKKATSAAASADANVARVGKTTENEKRGRRPGERSLRPPKVPAEELTCWRYLSARNFP